MKTAEKPLRVAATLLIIALWFSSANPETGWRDLNSRGESLLEDGSPSTAAELFLQASRRSPRAALPRLNLVQAHSRAGRHGDVLALAQRVLVLNISGQIDDPGRVLSGLYGLIGTAQHKLGRLELAAKNFERAVYSIPADAVAWAMLGNTRMALLEPERASHAFQQVLLHRTTVHDLLNLRRARRWTCDWQQWHLFEARLRHHLISLSQSRAPDLLGGVPASETAGLLPPPIRMEFARQHAAAIKQHWPARNALEDAAALAVWARRFSLGSDEGVRELRLGLLSADWGNHPVGTLVRGALAALLSRVRIRIFCYALTPSDGSWWWKNSSSMCFESASCLWRELAVERSSADAAEMVRSDGLDVLIELGGHTMHSGIAMLSQRLAPVQASFLGSAYTTASNYVDWFVGDAASVPIETASSLFVERLLMLGDGTPGLAPGLMPTDHAALQRAALPSESTLEDGTRRREKVNATSQALSRALLAANSTGSTLERCLPAVVLDGGRAQPKVQHMDIRDWYEGTPSIPFVFAFFGNLRNASPGALDAWCNLLRTHPGTFLWLLRHRGSRAAEPRFLKEAEARGIDSSRLIFTERCPWLLHTAAKGAASLILDTFAPNGHSVTADALWAGVPIVTIAGAELSDRIAASLLRSAADYSYSSSGRLRPPLGVVRSVKEYEIVATRLSSGDPTLKGAYAVHRAMLETARRTSALFDTRRWSERLVRQLRATTEIRAATVLSSGKVMHVLSPRGGSPRATASGTQVSNDPPSLATFLRTPMKLKEPLLLHLGGHERKRGWIVVDVRPRPDGVVDAIARAEKLEGAEKGSATAIYASHVLEHLDYRADVGAALSRWHEVLVPGGLLLLAVPDLVALGNLIGRDSIPLQEHFQIIRMILGGHVDEHDYHLSGFSERILTTLLHQAGFCDVRRQPSFGIFRDSSELVVHGVRASLNLVSRSDCGPNASHLSLPGLITH